MNELEVDTLHLKTLAAIVDGGSLERAASALGITPSAVSQRLRTMEQRLGRVLVQRSRPAQATEAGQALLRLARQVRHLEHEAATALGVGATGPVEVPLVVNADSLATWALPALAPLAASGCIVLDIRREDEAHSTDLLRAGAVMAAVTSTPEPVQGCTVDRLGAMRYRALATPEFAARWFPGGATAATIAIAPTMDFDRLDDLQDRFIRRITRRTVAPPRHHVPGSDQFADAVRRGMGWAMLPDLQTEADRAAGNLVEIGTRPVIDVPLFWQRWRLDSPALAEVTAALRAGAATALR
ncbi:LysR family transcriptional regulator ArgP [Nocardioides sp. AE5]|uniref:LysR family transcriptional regulator ArgP n=1 Tax=Nocardioides sp. AE5 TaxID=2962573 RepID=UPI002881BEEB|nr:LysR family transcriptional regulator ArgP [Nocardioides sp. AE5]MDT0202972.1 LysR family transcriptional regulator ArgP [Nocardioides sp. AE5]